MICPLASAELTGLAGNAGMSWWQTAGGLVAVFGLLVLCLRLLGRFQKSRAGDRASVLTVWPLGPKREIQVLRLGDAVHYVYRHDGAMVVLDKESLAVWEAQQTTAPHGSGTADRRGLLGMGRFQALMGRVGNVGAAVRTPAS